MEAFWQDALAKIKNEVRETSYEQWFSPATVIRVEKQNDTVYICVVDKFAKNAIETLYMPMLTEVLSETLGEAVFPEIIDLSNESVPENRPSPAAKKSDYAGAPYFNPRYTFDSFVVGSSNRFSHAAAMAVAESPSRTYNPLFIYGGSGLGKTHLMHAIGQAVLKNSPGKKVVYVSSEAFTNEFITMLRENRLDAFKTRYRNTDILLIDDIQFLAGKESTQEEFFHTFNTLHNAGKQIVLASDRPAKEIKSLEERLRTRFEWGLTADIQPPDFETRVAIVKRKAELLNLDLPDDVAEYIANHLKQNIRQLEGAVKKLNAYYMLEGIAPCIGVTTTAIKDTLNDTQPIPVTIEKIINEVARTYNVIPSDIRGKKRSANVSAARQMSMYIIREITGMSMEAIGSEFQRDHSTVVYSINTMEKNIGKDRHLKETVDDIMKNIRA